jgi:hypothetical protein
MTAFSPGASPPPVLMAIRRMVWLIPCLRGSDGGVIVGRQYSDSMLLA